MELFQLPFFIIFLLLHVQSVVSADPRFEACEPRNCGTGPNISYPFYIHGVGVDFCGRPGFKIECQEEKPIYSTTRGPYVVKDISYVNQTFRLFAAELDNATCLAPSHYFIFDDSSLSFLSNHADIQFFYGCNETFSLNSENSSVPCASNSSYHSFVALVPNGVTMSDGEGCQSTIGVPIDLDGDQSTQTIRTVDYIELLKKGFNLEWPGDACGKICGESGGRCGYENGVSICLCPDGTHPESCKKDPRFEACEPRNCGTGPNISYPFYIHGVGVDFCGRPGFKIECKDEKPIYSTTRGPYVVKDISYVNQTFRLFAAELDNATCLAPSHYFIFDDSSLSFLSNHADIQFFYGCNETFSLNSENSSVPCASNSSYHSFVTLVPNGVTMSDGEGCQSTIAVPINLDGDQSIQTIRTVDYVELLKKGFNLEWPGDACGKFCGESGGRCGYENGASICLCPDGTHPESCKKGKSGRTTLIIVGIVSVVAILVVSIIIWCLWRKYSINNYFTFCRNPRNKKSQDVEAFLRNNNPFLVRRYSYLGVKNMTNSFSEKLGQGGYGSVYKGKLSDGRFVAVKVLNKLKGNGEEFINEVATISRTSHVNVVTLLGFCYEGRKRALIYEFMPNGSLEKFIFDENPQSNNHNKLGWEMLYQISLGIARGLEYLHRGCNTRILHFDIKPHNILLDDHFSPRISDFGLARVCSREESVINMSRAARGTVGYIAPELYNRNFGGVSHKSDVYSYGMMVLEMVGGTKNVNVGGHTSDIYFPSWIYKRIELNEELGLKRIVNEEDQIKVKKMIMVSLWCIQTNPLNRPAMSEVIEMIEGNLDSLQVPPTPFMSSP